MKIRIEKTCIIGRYNLVDDSKSGDDDDRYLRQLSSKEVCELGKSIIDLVRGKE